jgi:hypothetical protein
MSGLGSPPPPFGPEAARGLGVDYFRVHPGRDHWDIHGIKPGVGDVSWNYRDGRYYDGHVSSHGPGGGRHPELGDR